MRQFIDLGVSPQRRQTVVRPTSAYVEIQSHAVDPPGIGYTYVLAGEAAGTYLAAACWGREFDRLSDAEVGPRLYRLCPVLNDLIAQGIDRRLDRGAIVQMVDPDDDELKWFVVRLVGDLAPELVRGLVEHPRMRRACEHVLALSLAVREELRASDVGALI